MLEVWLLGRFEVRLDNESITIPSRSAQSLLAYILLNAGLPQRREKLAGLLWPDTTESKARDNLRHALWRMRQALAHGRLDGDRYILADQLSITFDAHSDYWLDTSILECCASDRATAADLMKLLVLYQNELLPGFGMGRTMDCAWSHSRGRLSGFDDSAQCAGRSESSYRSLQSLRPRLAHGSRCRTLRTDSTAISTTFTG